MGQGQTDGWCGAPGFIRVMIQLPDDVGDWPVARDCASSGRIVRRFKEHLASFVR